jgi:hypothetical protein
MLILAQMPLTGEGRGAYKGRLFDGETSQKRRRRFFPPPSGGRSVMLL